MRVLEATVAPLTAVSTTTTSTARILVTFAEAEVRGAPMTGSFELSILNLCIGSTDTDAGSLDVRTLSLDVSKTHQVR